MLNKSAVKTHFFVRCGSCIPCGPFSGPCLSSGVGQGDIQKSLQTSVILLLMDDYLWLCFCFIFYFFSPFLFWHCISQSSLLPFGITVAQYLYSNVTSIKEWYFGGVVGCGILSFFPQALNYQKRRALPKPRSNAKHFSFPRIHSSSISME